MTGNATTETTAIIPSSTAAVADQTAIFIQHSIYILQGTVLTISNFLIICAVMTNKELRKEKGYVIVAGLALADVLSGLFELIAGCSRFYLALINETYSLVSRRYCMIRPENLIGIASTPLQGLMLLVVSVDRMHAVARPFKYFALTSGYAYKLCGVAYLFIGAMSVFGWVYSWTTQDDTPSVHKVCYTSRGLDSYFYQVRTWIGLFGSFASIIVYALIFPVYRCTKNSFNENGTTTKKTEREAHRERRLLITLGYSSFFTFILVCMGHLVMTISVWVGNTASLGIYAYITSQCNPILNLLLYSARHEDIRIAVFKLMGFRLKSDKVGSSVGANSAVNRASMKPSTRASTKPN